MNRRRLLIYLGLLGVAILLVGCAGAAGEPGEQGPPGPQGDPGPPGEMVSVGDLTCAECHNDTTRITGKRFAWSESRHGAGEAFVRGTSSRCAGCHSGGAFSERIAAGLDPDEVEAGDPNPTRQDCRACHQIHTTFTAADFALETTDPVAMFAYEGVTYDGGDGNLCVNCHQSRRDIAEAVDGMIEAISHWGPHHGPQSAMLLGIGGGGEVEGRPSAHYNMVEDTCVGCHMGEDRIHTFEPDVAACLACHADAEDFDINGTQAEVQVMLDELEEALIAAGWLDEEGHPAVASIPEEEAVALWNWIYIAHEDKSLGVHNPAYTKALLEAALEAMQ